MIKGIGLDIIELERIKKAMQRSEKFALRILSIREQAFFAKLSDARRVEFLAGRFAAKEAYAKANGTGIGKGCELQQIEILKNELGAPELYFDDKRVKGFVTITHTQTVAAAQVVLME
ncbi:holo-ACP synthase [Bacillus ndiopicus]|uniref:holo-ACP synthase n=1 Tax=Bacillus ndiopicus TaxID=1347368 RepID=UPI0005AB4621|nr:holo-ACP synthase [Bacillus ndiopicus]